MRHRRFDQRMALLYAIQHQSFQFQALQLLYGKLFKRLEASIMVFNESLANLPDWMSARAAFMFSLTSSPMTRGPVIRGHQILQYLNMIDAFS